MLTTLTSKTGSYCTNNLVRNVTVPSKIDLYSAVMNYIRLRPLELATLQMALSALFMLGTPLVVEEVVRSLVPKLKQHPQSLDLVHSVDLCQDDLAALLHLIMKVSCTLAAL